MSKMNPFLTNGYVSAEYFCDRTTETETLLRYLTNGNNAALISPRRLGKTGLISHCFHQKAIADSYYHFLVDIYATKNLQEFVFELGKSLLNTLKPKGRSAWESFLGYLASLRAGISFDFSGNPSWNIEMGDIKSPTVTLDEIFHYLAHADKPCIVAIDEFQTIAHYPEANVEALLRTYMQHCTNATFVYAGSQRHLMGEIFTSPARPFYQSTAIMELRPIPLSSYTSFIQRHFVQAGKQISEETLEYIHKHKTGALLTLCVRMGAILAEVSQEDLERLTSYAEKIGLAFQIKDDILSEEGDEKVLGKPVGNDKILEKCTYVSQYGLEGAKEKLEKLTKEAIEELAVYHEKAEFLIELAKYIKERNK